MIDRLAREHLLKAQGFASGIGTVCIALIGLLLLVLPLAFLAWFHEYHDNELFQKVIVTDFTLILLFLVGGIFSHLLEDHLKDIMPDAIPKGEDETWSFPKITFGEDHE